MASLDGASSDPAAEWSMSCFGQQGPEWDLLTCKGYRWVRMLGRGQYGTAHLVEKGGEQVVAKVVVLDQLKDRDRALALQEVEVLSRLHHPNIVSHIASWLHKGVPGLPGQEALVNVMEFCAGGDLRAWLEACAASGEQLSESLVLGLFAQMLAGVEYVHSHRVLHRDLKTSNMFLDGARRGVKIGDFGIARVLESTAAVAVTMLGTPYYMSPEVCKGEPYREKSDMWSLGCVLYEMCMLRHAFQSQSLLGLVYCIVSECYDPIPKESYSAGLAELVARLLAKSVEARPTASEALAMEVLRPFRPSSGGACAPVELPQAPMPPPPPPQARHSAPRPPPSPREHEDVGEEDGGAVDSLEERCNPLELGTSSSSTAPAPPWPEPEAAGAAAARSLPALRRPAPPQPPADRPPAPGAPGTVSSPPRVPTAFPAAPVPPPSRQGFRLLAAAGAPPLGVLCAELDPEMQVLISRVRGGLLRRPRSLGNWVQAFALHDTTGLGVLGAEQFAAFLSSLSLGLSRQEVRLVTDCLTGGSGTVSLGAFSQAITPPPPDGAAEAERRAARAAGVLAGESPRGLLDFVGSSPSQVVATMAQPLPAGEVERLLAWLPKNPDGLVDWCAAEDWRTSVLNADTTT